MSNPAALLLAVYAIVVIRNAWLCDDIYITFRTVEQFWAGNGLVWNLGERVQAYTHPLWLLVLILVQGVTHEYFYTPLAVSICVSLAAVAVAARPMRQNLFALLLFVWLLLLSKAFIDYSTSGLENPLSHLLLAGFLWLYLKDGFSLRRLALLTLLTSLSLLTRHDLLLIFGPALLWYAWPGLKHIRTWAVLALGLTPLIAWEFFSLLYYGFPFPNTAYAKLNTLISRPELIHQGLIYLFSSLLLDPVSILVILLCLIAIAWGANAKYRIMAVGIALYMLYIVNVGGDFMVGRFLSLPFFAAAILLVWRIQNGSRQLLMVAIAATVVGLLNPAHSPLLFAPTEEVNDVPENGIADEKAYYFARRGLLPSARLNRLFLQGFKEEYSAPWSVRCGRIGAVGFMTALQTYIIDQCGLTDALLARLPARYDVNWRAGHFNRAVPEGYVGTVHTGSNLLVDPNLALYYDKLRMLISGPIFSWTRLQEIWRFNTGQYNHLIDTLAYLYPGALHLNFEHISRVEAGEAVEPAELPATQDGYFIEFDESIPAEQILVGMECAILQVAYYDSGQGNEGHKLLSMQVLHRASVKFGGDSLVLLDVPKDIHRVGTVTLHLLPRDCADNSLQFVDLIPGAQYADSISEVSEGSEAAETARPTLEQLLDLYYVQYQQLYGAKRAQVLAEIKQRLSDYPQTEWQALSSGKRVALLDLPNSALHELVIASMGDSLPVANLDGEPALRYLGADLDQEDNGFEVELDFEVLAHVKGKFALQMRAIRKDKWGKIIEYPLDDPDATWNTGMLQEVSTIVDLPADAELSDYLLCFVPTVEHSENGADDEQCWPMKTHS